MMCSRDPECKHRIRIGEWYHVVATVADGSHTLYVDGARQDSVEGGSKSHAEQPLHIGRKGTVESCFFFRGAIDDIRMYDRVLSTAEIGELFHEGGFTKPPHRLSSHRRDPISGRWGEHGVNFFDLQLDGAGRITGNVMDGRPERRAVIESGTFDAATGALRLQGHGVHFKSGEPLPFVIEGVLDEGEITVTATFGGWSGNFCLSRNGARWPWRYALARRLNRLIRRALGVQRSHEE
jgi:hypothetical protein